jgi:hypothetical protein
VAIWTGYGVLTHIPEEKQEWNEENQKNDNIDTHYHIKNYKGSDY